MARILPEPRQSSHLAKLLMLRLHKVLTMDTLESWHPSPGMAPYGLSLYT
jgi:hypothetical protein